MQRYKVFFNSEQLSEQAVFEIKQKIEAAGGIVKNAKNEVLMIYRLNKWDFPKGKVEQNESIEKAACREVLEETGVKVETTMQPLPSTYHVYWLREEKVLKQTHWFLMKAIEPVRLIPQSEEDIAQAVWVPESEVAQKLKNSYISLQEFWKDYQNL